MIDLEPDDLRQLHHEMNAIAGAEVIARLLRILPCAHPVEQPAIGRIVDRDAELLVAARDIFGLLGLDITLDRAEQDCRAARTRREAVLRSEAHTYALQSLMRRTYA